MQLLPGGDSAACGVLVPWQPPCRRRRHPAAAAAGSSAAAATVAAASVPGSKCQGSWCTETLKKTRDGSASARVMQRAELLQCAVEYLGDDKDLCSAATLCRTARDDTIWSPLVNRLCNEFPLPQYSHVTPGFNEMDMEAPPGFVRPEMHEHGMDDPYLSPRFNRDTGVLEFGFVSPNEFVLNWYGRSKRACQKCRRSRAGRADSHAAFRAHCRSWRHCESRREPSERVPAAFVDPRHADPERFAQLPAARQWAALRRHVSAVLRQLRVPLADARVRANMERLADWARDELCDHEFLHEDEVQQALAGVTTSSAARACTDFCIGDLKSNGLCPGSYARVAIVDGWAN
ncbi:hypothetical protein JKP88DRAFT_249714 [Tribonema minus]|uniref:Uncharacterized protein n=1 Tax=Tribonema minus TaxID=303371 RepID=A0A835YTA7_9STRA|nr:hypothetical protein JKP88DRAFT_249714 [Tribonema minus]